MRARHHGYVGQIHIGTPKQFVWDCVTLPAQFRQFTPTSSASFHNEEGSTVSIVNEPATTNLSCVSGHFLPEGPSVYPGSDTFLVVYPSQCRDQDL